MGRRETVQSHTCGNISDADDEAQTADVEHMAVGIALCHVAISNDQWDGIERFIVRYLAASWPT